MAETYVVHFLGLDHAGKTTMVNRWSHRAYVPPGKATQTLEMHNLEINGVSLRIYDLPGQQRYQEFLWPSVIGSFTINTVLFFISAAEDEQERWSEAFESFDNVLSLIENKVEPHSLTVGVLANKIDTIPEEKRGEIFSQFFSQLQTTGIWNRLTGLCSAYRIFLTSALSGAGIEDVLDWLTINLTGSLPPKHPTFQEVHIIKETGLPVVRWVNPFKKGEEIDRIRFSGLVSAFQAFSSEIRTGEVETIETITSKIVFIRENLKEMPIYVVILAEKRSSSRDLFNFGIELRQELTKRNIATVTANPTLFKGIVENVYWQTFGQEMTE
ncbi:MAG: ADP-ribosylation factor-like protein [Candidatus Hodarchaeota archaeon]